MVEQGQKSIFQKRLYASNNRGQALVEYILLLVITVALILGAKNAFSNVNAFMEKYVGSYIECLMEYGELPTLGVAEADLKKHSMAEEGGGQKVCEARFAGFTFSGGRPPTNTGGTDDGSNGGSNTGGTSNSPGRTGSSRNGGSRDGRSGSVSGENNRNSSRSADANSRRGSRSGIGADGSDSGDGGSSRSGRGRSAYANGRIKRSSDNYGTADGSSASSKVSNIEDGSSEDSDSRRRGGRRSSRVGGVRYVYDRTKYRAITGRMEQEIERTMPKKTVIKPTTRTVAKVKSGDGLVPYKKVFNPPETKRTVASQDDDSGISFGNFFKWLIIIGMIVAIVVFFGGQLLNYSNSKD